MGEEALDGLKPCFDVGELWKGDNGAKLFHKAMAHLAKAPMTLVHGDMNPGNIWKSKQGKTGDDKYCFIDWQLFKMAPAACEFATPQIGMVHSPPCTHYLQFSMLNYCLHVLAVSLTWIWVAL